MAKSKKIVHNSVFRFMCIRTVKGTNYHKDFPTKEESLKYAAELKDKTIEWYGIYEISDLSQNLIPIISKRILRHK